MIGTNLKILEMIEETLTKLIENQNLKEDNPVVLLKENHQLGKWSEAEFILLSFTSDVVCTFKVPVNPDGDISLRALYECITLAYAKGLANSL